MFNIQSYADWNFNKIDLMMFKNFKLTIFYKIYLKF